MNQPLRLLAVEDSISDLKLLLYALGEGGYDVTHEVVSSADAMRTALETSDWDVITSDHYMPKFRAPAALALAKELRPDLPFIIVSGEINLDLAVSMMREGAADFIQKRELLRVVPVITRCLREVEARRDRKRAEEALRVSESRYRRLFETAQDGIFLLDADTGTIFDANPFLIEMLSYSKEQLVGKKLWELGVFKDINASKKAFDELKANGYVRYDDLPLQGRDGREIAVEFVSNVYVVDQGEVIQCNIRDISARKRAELALHTLTAELEQRVTERTRQLEELNKELESFSYSISHDLRAPLRNVNGFVQLLQKECADRKYSKQSELLENISCSVNRMSDLIDALLRLAHLSIGELKRECVDISAAVHRIAQDLQEHDPARQAEWIIAEGVTVNADPQLVKILLDNVLGNAWKFTAPRVLAHIEFGVAPQDNGSVAYFVRDNGSGFDMIHADRMFGAFQRLHSEKEFPGIGVGLAIVQRIIHRHDGRVWADSAVDKGTTLYFTLI